MSGTDMDLLRDVVPGLGTRHSVLPNENIRWPSDRNCFTGSNYARDNLYLLRHHWLARR